MFLSSTRAPCSRWAIRTNRFLHWDQRELWEPAHAYSSLDIRCEFVHLVFFTGPLITACFPLSCLFLRSEMGSGKPSGLLKGCGCSDGGLCWGILCLSVLLLFMLCLFDSVKL